MSLTFKVSVKQLCDRTCGCSTAHAYLFFILLFFFHFPFFLWSKLCFFLLFPFAFIFTSFVSHITISVMEIEYSS